MDTKQKIAEMEGATAWTFAAVDKERDRIEQYARESFASLGPGAIQISQADMGRGIGYMPYDPAQQSKELRLLQGECHFESAFVLCAHPVNSGDEIIGIVPFDRSEPYTLSRYFELAASEIKELLEDGAE